MPAKTGTARPALLGLTLLSIGSLAPAAPAPTPGLHWDIGADRIASDCAAAAERARARVAATLATDQEENGPLARLVTVETALAELDEALVPETLLATVGTGDEVREASSRCRQRVAQVGRDTAGDPAVYALALAARAEARRSADRRLAEYYLQRGRQAGAHLAAGARARMRALLGRLSALEAAFQQALADEQVNILVSDAEAASLPPALVAGLEEVEGGYRVPVSYSPLYRQFMASMAAPDARERYLNAFYRLGGEDNLRRVDEAVALRQEIATLAGYESWADYRLEPMMAGSPERAMKLLVEVDEALMGKAREEATLLAAMKAADGHPGPLAAWDFPYFQARLEAERRAVDDEALRAYLPVARVVPAVMALYGELFGVRFRPAEGPVWAPGVLHYAMVEADGEAPIAWVYIDLAPRPGRFTRPASYPLRAGRRLADGGYLRPVSAIIGNGPAAGPGRPAQFGHQDLVEFFHEFGHLMDTTLCTAPYASLFGMRWPGDFVEAPSQMMENWAWDPDILVRVSGHVETGEPMPRPLATAVPGLRQGDSGLFWTRQAFLAAFDLALHGPAPVPPANELWFELQSRMTPLPGVPGTFPPAAFLPVMGGYDANYYGYVWSRVYARDLFTAFEEGGPTGPAVGRRFRRQVLEPGSSVPPEQLVRRFLGRPVSPEAFYRELGISP